MAEEWIREQLENLKIKDLRTNTLNEIKNQLVTNPELSTSNLFLQSPLFELAKEDNDEQKKLACDILSICMSNLNIQHTENNFSEIIEKSLCHDNPNIQVLGLNEILRVTKHSVDTITQESIVLLLIKCLQSKETKVGTPTIEILGKLLPNFIDFNSIKVNLENLLNNCDDIIRCRIYNVGIIVARKSPILLEKTDFILKRAVQDLQTNDLLLQLNILEILSDLTLESYGLTYVENKGVFNQLIKKIETIEEDPIAGILIPGLMKFFGNVAAIHPSKIFKDYPIVINALFDCLLSDDDKLIKPGYETLGHLAKSDEGKIALDATGRIEAVLKSITDTVPNQTSDLKVQALNCLESVFSINPVNTNNQISYICQKWFDTIAGGPASQLGYIMKLCQNPFPDISLATFGFLKSLVLHKFGQSSVANTGGFIEYLLDRTITRNKEILQEKYDVIKYLSDTNAFDAQITLQLKKYVREGPFYVQGVTEIAFEGST